jgi:hypothetical protein
MMPGVSENRVVAMRRRITIACVLGCLFALPAGGSAIHAADGFDQPPIEYSTAQPSNSVSELQGRIEAGKSAVKYEDRLGYLRTVLEELKIPIDSQVLVFSQTSLQRHLITPETPRAIYFNDDVYIGYCHNGEVLEISTADSRL